jgi:heme/copper-type cytochrome/quinol oxidase subunit 2
MVLAASEAFVKTLGLIVTFGGIGVIVNVILVYIAVQIRDERRQNQEYLESRRPPGT